MSDTRWIRYGSQLPVSYFKKSYPYCRFPYQNKGLDSVKTSLHSNSVFWITKLKFLIKKYKFFKSSVNFFKPDTVQGTDLDPDLHPR
jgi:hypothetical protein